MSNSPPRVHLVQLAGGKGLRVGGDTPKQFRATNRGILLGVSLGEFLKLPKEVGQVVSITVTASKQWENVVMGTLSQLPLEDVCINRADPGSTRTESTWHALQLIHDLVKPHADDLVAIHDAARPFATAGLLAQLVEAAAASGAAVPGIPVADTIVQTEAGNGTAVYLDRAALVAVQTPQVFRWELLYDAHRWAAQNEQSFTDDGGLVAHQGTDPVVITGEQTNWKVTTEGDWLRAVDLF